MRGKGLIRDFVFGMEDGLVSNFGLVLGVYVGGGNQYAILLAGLASMFAGAFSMSAGSYLSAKSQREVYEHEIESTKEELEKNPRKCMAEMKKILRKEGIDKKGIDGLFAKNGQKRHPEFVCNYVVQRKVGITKDKFDNPLKNSTTMFFSFLFGSLFPIFPFFIEKSVNVLLVAAGLTISMLFFIGWAKSYYTKRQWFKSGLEIVIIGVAAGAIGYLVGLIMGILG